MAKPPRAGMGRPKGSKNLVGKSVRESILIVFRGLGGEEAMQAWAKENPNVYYQIYARLIPQEHSGPEGGPIPIAVHDHFNSGPPSEKA